MHASCTQSQVRPHSYFFHNLPVFWLLPSVPESGNPNKVHTLASKETIPDTVFDDVNNISDTAPRIFLSHQPPEYFEYAPTPRTRIVYLVRDPHAVWHSLLKFTDRIVDLLRAEHNLSGAHV